MAVFQRGGDVHTMCYEAWAQHWGHSLLGGGGSADAMFWVELRSPTALWSTLFSHTGRFLDRVDQKQGCAFVS